EPSIPSDLKIEVYLSDGRLYKGQLSIYDFYYNIATVKIKSTSPLSSARLRYIDDSVAINLEDLKKYVPVKHSTKFKLCPGERVVALGRDYEDPHEIMASPGVFRRVPRPWIGANIANLCSADLEKLDKLYQEFPNVSTGVIVKQVIGNRNIGSRKRTKVPNWTFWSPRYWFKAKAVLQHMEPKSPAFVAGLRPTDIIIKCDGVSVNSHLEFVEVLWDKEGKPLEMEFIRPGGVVVLMPVGWDRHSIVIKKKMASILLRNQSKDEADG
ncbi:hypothetical protein KSS87_023809, partial [Heliosperma pusillum]